MAYTIPDIGDIELKRFIEDPHRSQAYREGRNLLKLSGIFNFLRIFSRPYDPTGGSNVYRSAYSAAYTEGYNKCLEDLEYFEEKYLQITPSSQGLKADFGARRLLAERGDLMEEVVDGKAK